MHINHNVAGWGPKNTVNPNNELIKFIGPVYQQSPAIWDATYSIVEAKKKRIQKRFNRFA